MLEANRVELESLYEVKTTVVEYQATFNELKEKESSMVHENRMLQEQLGQYKTKICQMDTSFEMLKNENKKLTEVTMQWCLPPPTKSWKPIFCTGDTLSDKISADKIFGTKSKFRQFCPTKFFLRFFISPYNSQEKFFLHENCINLTCFRFQRTKYFGGQNFRQQVRFLAVLSAENLSD